MVNQFSGPALAPEKIDVGMLSVKRKISGMATLFLSVGYDLTVDRRLERSDYFRCR